MKPFENTRAARPWVHEQAMRLHQETFYPYAQWASDLTLIVDFEPEERDKWLIACEAAGRPLCRQMLKLLDEFRYPHPIARTPTTDYAAHGKATPTNQGSRMTTEPSTYERAHPAPQPPPTKFYSWDSYVHPDFEDPIIVSEWGIIIGDQVVSMVNGTMCINPVDGDVLSMNFDEHLPDVIVHHVGPCQPVAAYWEPATKRYVPLERVVGEG